MRRHLISVVMFVGLFAALLPATPAFAAPPPNDDFADALPIAGVQGSVPVSYDGATLEPGEPDYRPGRNTYGREFRSVWFQWTAPADGWYQFTLEYLDECLGSAPVFQGDSLDTVQQRSHQSATHWYPMSDVAFVNARKGGTFKIAAATTCPASHNPMALVWEQRGPFILTVKGPEDPAHGATVEFCQGNEPRGECYGDHISGITDAAGRVYFTLAGCCGHHGQYGGTWNLDVRPRSVNLERRVVYVSIPPPTRDAVMATRSVAATPSVDFDRDGLGDVVSGVPLADRGQVNAGAVVVRFGDGRRRVLDEASAVVPTDRVAGEQFGAAVSTADVDRDGWTDLTIGAPGEMVGPVRSGAVFVVFGSAEGLGNGRASVRYHQNLASVAGQAANGDRFGAAVAPSVRFLYTHIVVGAPGKDSGGRTDAGAVVRFTRFPYHERDPLPVSRIWHQGTSGVGGANIAGDRFGSSLAHGQFANRSSNDSSSGGYTSLAIGVPGKDVAGARDAGAVVVLRAAGTVPNYETTGNPLITQNSKAVVPGAGAGADHAFGSSLVAFWEQVPFNHPPRHRLAVGAPGEGGGTVTVLSTGEDQPLAFAPAEENTRLVQGVGGVPGANEAGDRFGAALAVGDFNDDALRDGGHLDLIVGAPGEEVDGRAASGSVAVLYGADSSDGPTRWVVGGAATVRPGVAGVPGRASAGARFGTSVSALDIDGNGYPDAVGGAPGSDATVANGGAVYVGLHDADGLRGGRVVLWPEASANDGFGAQLAAPQR